MALKKCKECDKEISKKAKECPNCGVPQGPKQYSIGKLILLLLLGGFIYSLFTTDQSSTTTTPSTSSSPSGSGTSQSAPSAPKKTSAPMPKYEIVDRDKYDTPLKTQIELHAVVSGTITEPGLRQLLHKFYDEANSARAFKYYGGKPTHVFIYLYTSREHFKSGMGQWIAMLIKTGEDSQVDTQVKTELISQLTAKPEIKYGLLESKREEIFRAMVTAEDRADADAQRMYPIPDPRKSGYSQARANAQIDKQTEALFALTKKYKAEVAKRYDIREEQLRQISLEAIEKNWPMP